MHLLVVVRYRTLYLDACMYHQGMVLVDMDSCIFIIHGNKYEHEMSALYLILYLFFFLLICAFTYFLSMVVVRYRTHYLDARMYHQGMVLVDMDSCIFIIHGNKYEHEMSALYLILYRFFFLLICAFTYFLSIPWK
jgi:uncharacterized membrane protein